MNGLLDVIVQAALEAGAEIQAIYGAGCAAEVKEDGSPVTEADRRAEAIILARLAAAFPDIPVLAEEEACAGRIPPLGRRFFCVDPLDGTKGFVDRTGEFTVNIALVEDGAPVAGVVYAPDSHALFYGARGEGAWRQREGSPLQKIRVRARPESGLVAVCSRNHRGAETEDWIASMGIAEFVPAASSLKFCTLAEGMADVYPRHGPTMEWDTAAGQAVLEAAGGRVAVLEGDTEAGPLRYGRVEAAFRNPNFIAWGGG